MPNSSGTFKTGERSLQKAQYECLNCRALGKTTVVTVEAGVLLPYCTVCNLKDNTWKTVRGGK